MMFFKEEKNIQKHNISFHEDAAVFGDLFTRTFPAGMLRDNCGVIIEILNVKIIRI
jgi:uncharacterized DUF497 family protein